MKLYRIPNAWDYHGIAAIYVVANTPEEAVEKAKAKLAAAREKHLAERTVDNDDEKLDEGNGSYGNDERIRTSESVYDDGPEDEPDWDKVTEITDGVFFANGCND